MESLINSKLKSFYFIGISTGILMWTYTVISYLYVHELLFQIGLACSLVHNLSMIRIRENNLRLRINLIALTVFVYQISFSFFTGGFFSVVITWIAILPLIVGLVAKRKDVIVWILITCITPFVFYYFQNETYVLYNEKAKYLTHIFTSLGMIILNGVFTFIMISLFQKIRKQENHNHEINTIFKSFASLSQVSHDINNGFMKIISELLLMEKLKGVDVSRVKMHVQDTISDLSILQNDIKSISFAEKYDFIEKSIMSYKDRFEQKVQFETEGILNDKINIFIIEKVLETLIKNAEEANASLSKVKIVKTNNNLVINFSDNGDKIKEPKKIFEPFYSDKNLLTNRGVGLSSLKLLLNKVNGSVELKNEEKKEFVVKIEYNKIKENEQK